MLYWKSNISYELFTEEEEATLRAKHAKGEVLFTMENGYERVMSTEEESEIRAFWALSEQK